MEATAPTKGVVPEDAPNPGALEFFAMAALALVIEVGLVLHWAQPVPGLAWVQAVVDGGVVFMVCHLALAVTLVAWTISRRRRALDQRFAGLLTITTAFLGPSGPLCTLMCAATHAIFKRYATGFHDWYLSLFPESEVAPAEALYELIVTGRERAGAASVESFTDIMTVGSPQQKQAVIALVARHFRPIFTPALKLGLADADPSVRVQAATATARVEHEFNEAWQRLGRIVQAKPTDPEARYNLARHLDEYAFCGLLDTNREQELRRKALAEYLACLDGDPLHIPARNDCGRLMLRVGQVAEAAAVMEPVITITTDRRTLAWYAESLFRLGRFADLRALCVARGDALLGEATLFDSLANVVELWIADAIEAEDGPAIPPIGAGGGA